VDWCSVSLEKSCLDALPDYQSSLHRLHEFIVSSADLPGSFLPMLCYSSTGTSHGPVSFCLCLCLSGTSRSSVETDERIELVLARELPSTRPALC